MFHVTRVSLTLGVLLLLFTPLSVHASTPTRQVIPVNVSFISPPGGSLNPCNQPLSIVVQGTVYYINYYDQAGNLVRQLSTSPDFTFTVTGPNGMSLIGQSPAPQHDYVSGNTLTVVFTGEQIRFTIPGSGNVLSIAGNQSVTFDLTTGAMIASSFSGEMNTDAAAYCSYLGAT